MQSPEVKSTPRSSEKSIKIEDLSHEPKILDEEVKPWIETTENNAYIPQSVQSMGVTQSGPLTPVLSQPVITLPLTHKEEEIALHKKVGEAMRWLAEWCMRQTKMVHAKLKESTK